MTDDRLDALASAHLDGATSPEEAMEVAADPRLQATVRDLRAVRDAIRTVPPADPDRRELAIAAALAAFAEPSARADARVTSIAGAAARRRPSNRSLRLLGAAAAAALLVALVPLLGRLSRSDRATTAAPSAQDPAGPPGAADSSAGQSPAGAEAGPALSTTTSAVGAASFGDFESLEALVAAVEDPGPPSAEQLDQLLPDGRAADAACPAQREVVQDRSARPLDSGTAILAGSPVTVLFLTTDDGSRVVQAVLDAVCTPLLERP